MHPAEFIHQRSQPSTPARLNMFENLSLGHLVVVMVIFVLLFGAKRIPEIAASLGQGINEFKKTMNGAEPSLAAPQPPRQSVPLGGTESVASDDRHREPKRLL